MPHRWISGMSKIEREHKRAERKAEKAARLQQRRLDRQHEAVENLAGRPSDEDPTIGK